jgi:hypothetical protein
MGCFRRREVEVSLAVGEEIRIADAPVSEPVRNLSIQIVPWTKGGTLPGASGTINWEVFYGGGHDLPARGPAPFIYGNGVSQGSGTLAAAANALPVTIHTDAAILDQDRVLRSDTMELLPHAGTARAVHLENILNVGTLNCKVIFISETISEVN